MGVRVRLRAGLSFVAFAALACAVGACSLGALNGFSGGGQSNDDGGASTQVLVDGDAGAGEDGAPPPNPPPPGPGPDASAACVPSGDQLCASFDGAVLSDGFAVASGAGSFGPSMLAVSPPHAVRFELGDAGAIGPRLTAYFGGSWTSLVCTVQIAIETAPTASVVDIFGFETDTGGVHEEAALRISSNGLSLISCRNSSDCRPEKDLGALAVPPGAFHEYRFEWKRAGDFLLMIDGSMYGQISTKSQIDGGTSPQINLGLFFRPFGTSTAAVRFDDLVCTRSAS